MMENDETDRVLSPGGVTIEAQVADGWMERLMAHLDADESDEATWLLQHGPGYMDEPDDDKPWDS